MSESDTPKQVLPDPRPSYLENDSKPSRKMSDFQMHVVKELEPDFEAEVTQEESTNGDDCYEKIRTFLRIRPSKNNTGLFTEKDMQTLAVAVEGANPKRQTQIEKNETLFKFTKVLGPESTQIQVFDECVSSILEKLFINDNCNCLIFGYGATNSGKTHTMQGYGNDFGIVPRTLEYLFNFLEDKLYLRGDIKPYMFNQQISLSERDILAMHDTKLKIIRDSSGKLSQAEMDSFTSSLRPSLSASIFSGGSSNLNMHGSIINSVPAFIPGEKYVIPDDATLYGIWVSFAELYNEKVFDLFDSSSLKTSQRRKELKLMADKKGHVYIKDLIEVSVTSAEEAYKLFLAGKANLRFAATEMNATSSRSHCFFSIRIVKVGTQKGNVYPKTVQRLSFCDLAGAERASQTGNIGNRLKESGNINQSLLVLLRCIRAMRDIQNKKNPSSDFIPFRESKLTRLFQSYLTTASHICMIVNINPDPKNLDSTLQVLHNSAIASEVIAFRKVEPPNNDTKFYRKVRESISHGQSMKQKMPNANLHRKKTDDERYALKTVVAKSKATDNKNSMGRAIAYIHELQAVITELKKDVEERDDHIERLKSIENLRAQQEQEAEIQSEQYDKAFDVLNKKRLSLQARMLRDDHEKEIALLKQTFETNMEISDEYETMSEDEDKENCPLNEMNGTPRPSHLLKNLALKNKKIKELTDLNADLSECVSALQCSLDLKNKEVIALTLELQNKEAMYMEVIETQVANTKRIEEEYENFTVNDPKAREETTRQLIDLNKLNEKIREENTLLKVELQDGQATCLEYDRKLEEANDKIERLNSALNTAMAEKREQKEELEIMHYSYENMETKLKKYERNERDKTTIGTVTTPTLSVGLPVGLRRNANAKYKITPTKLKRHTKSKQDVSMAFQDRQGDGAASSS